MTVVDRLRVRSAPSTGEESTIYGPVLPKGTRFQIAEGPVAGSGYWWYRVADLAVDLQDDVTTGWVSSSDRAGTPWIGPSPASCEDAPLPFADISVSTLGELQRGLVGRWSGCLTLPWAVPYWVDMEFREDGTYSASAPWLPPPQVTSVLYYGMDADHPAKTWSVDSLRVDRLGRGTLYIVETDGRQVPDQLLDIRLMGDALQFHFYHEGQYGPLSFWLYRIET